MKKTVLGAVAALSVGLAPASAQEMQEVTMALPSTSLTFSTHFIAEDAGFYEKEGLKVTTREITGVGSVNAVLGGSAEFTIGTGATFLRAVARGQKLIAIANMVDKPMIEMVLSKKVADEVGFKPEMTLAEKGALLKGRTVAIQGVGSIVDTTVRLVAQAAKLDPESDMSVSPLEPPSMLAALKAGQADAFATSMPWTTQAVVEDAAVMMVSGPRGDLADYSPFAYLVLEVLPATCEQEGDLCGKMARAFRASAQFIKEQPDKALELIQKRFAQMDPKLVAAAWETAVAATAADVSVTEESLANAQKYVFDSGLLKEEELVKDLSIAYTDKYLK